MVCWRLGVATVAARVDTGSGQEGNRLSSADDFLRAMGIPRHDEGGDRPAAPDPAAEGSDAVGDLEELRREAEALQRRFARGQNPSARHDGRDGSGSVHVTVGGDGRVVDLQLDRTWRQSVGPHALGAAVLEAVGDASIRRLGAWAEAVADDPGPPADGIDRTPRPVVRSGAPADSAAARRAVQDMLSLLEGVEADLEDLERRIDQRMQQQVVGRSPTHQVTVRVRGGGEVIDVEVQRRFVDRTDDRGIARELRSAFQAAYERVGTLGLGGLLGEGRLAQLHALGSDPTALLGRLGLGPR